MRETLAEQTQSAFNFISKLYFETSYLIKEVEGQLHQEKEEFVIGRPSGYAVTTRTSTGLDPTHVEMWLPKDLTVFFVPKALTETRRGQTYTPLTESLRALLLHMQLHGKHLDEPRVLAGCISQVRSRKESVKKFESVMWTFAYHTSKVFDALPAISYEQASCSYKGQVYEEPLYSINSAEDVEKLLVRPIVELYRQQPPST